MNSRLVVKFFIAIASGAFLGELIQLNYMKWHQLGREAFLSYQGTQFDQHIANPGSVAGPIVFCVIAVLGLATSFEMAIYGGVKLASLFTRGKSQSAQNA
jgi:hypothetical protein